MTYSIIIPHHDCSQLLLRCLASIPSRTDVEIIVVDDGSGKEERIAAARHAQAHKAQFIENNDRLGAGHARNIGLAHATGEWVFFADADDYFVPSFLSKFEEANCQDSDVVYFNFNTIDCVENKVWDVLPGFKKIMAKKEPSQEETMRLRFHCTPPWNKAVRLSFLKSHAIFFEEVPQGNDVFYTLQVAFWGDRYTFMNAQLYNYTKNTSGITRKKWTAEVATRYLMRNKQLNPFFDYIGKKEWRTSLFRRYATTLKKAGIKNALKAMMIYCFGGKEMLNYVQSIKQRETL